MKTQKLYKRTLTPITSVRHTISSLCIRLKRSFRPRPQPVKFTFDKQDILLYSTTSFSRLINPSDFIFDYRTFESPKVRIYNAKQLSKRISNRV